jgi:hypothetical protein
MAVVNSRISLGQYCLRQLGQGTIEINITQDQIEDRIDEALQYFQEYHSDAMHEVFYKVQVDSTDVDNGYITIPNYITTVTQLVPITEATLGGMFSYEYQAAFNDIYNIRSGGMPGISNYVLTKQHIELVKDILNTIPYTEHVRHANKIIFEGDDSPLELGGWIILQGYKIIDPEEVVSVYNDMFLKKYTASLFKRQWGSNLKKFGGILLPGGVTLDGQTLFDEGNSEITRLEEEMRLTHESPPDFFLG